MAVDLQKCCKLALQRAYQLGNTLPETDGGEMQPQAQSTPQVSRENTSQLLQQVRSNMQPRAKRAKRDK